MQRNVFTLMTPLLPLVITPTVVLRILDDDERLQAVSTINYSEVAQLCIYK